jgi:hypothetical protein
MMHTQAPAVCTQGVVQHWCRLDDTTLHIDPVYRDKLGHRSDRSDTGYDASSWPGQNAHRTASILLEHFCQEAQVQGI